jgi:predicted alpha/beta superfamily hydrolase
MKPILFLFLSFLSPQIFSQEITIGKRDKLYSEILQQDREFSVYFPPSYNTSVNQKYPVLYILDGDYNFQYVAGFLELQGAISEIIPEMILVAISGKATQEYRKNCKPHIEGVEDSGNAEEVANFIAQELIPYVNKNYKAADYKILGGHSVGGIFVINTAITHPDLFDNYIAISPALWWAKNAMEDVMKKTWGQTKSTTANVYVSLANEEGMGVTEFLKKVPENIREQNIKFQHFPNEIHNSVGLATYKWALDDIFKDWYVKEEYFSSADALKTHYLNVQKKYGSIFNIPFTVVGNTHYMLQKNDKEMAKVQTVLQELNPNALVLFNTYRAGKILTDKKYDEAENLVAQALKINPESFEAYHILAKIQLAKKSPEQAKNSIEKALQLAEGQQARQWQINELIETNAEIAKTNL